MTISVYIISTLIGYALGCILTADIVARRVAGRTVFEIGSQNPGMANVMAQLGKRAGFTVLAGDILKTVAALLIAWLLFGSVIGADALLISGAGAILGHNYPIWHRFRGGKGVTVTCTVLIITMPIWGTISCVVGGIITVITGFLPLGAVLIPAFAVVFSAIFHTTHYLWFSVFSLVIMLLRHRRGILRIIRGEEERMFRKG